MIERWLVPALVPMVLLSACGARTSLREDEPCETEGATRSCSTACGQGASTCTNGQWSACELPEITRICENDCGLGTQSCSGNGVWSECDVPVASRACTNDCGTGRQTCTAGKWSNCGGIPIATRSCTTECGTGDQSCSDGKWSDCQNVPVTTRACSSICGSGTESCIDGKWVNCDAPKPLPPKLLATVRDFHKTYPDMETPPSGLDLDIVAEDLGPDDRPVYRSATKTLTTSGAASFYAWYHDVPGTNQTTTVTIPLAPTDRDPGILTYRSMFFFPIDNQLFGNEGLSHNYHFTLETSTHFRYHAGEKFQFSGDDDLFVFMNRKLVINLGGLHESLSSTVQLDDVAEHLRLVEGQDYPLHLFFAERHTVSSTFAIETTISEFENCP